MLALSLISMLIAGIILLLIGLPIFTYCMLGVGMMSRVERPPVFLTSKGIVLQVSGTLLMLAGILLIFLINWIGGIVTLIALYFIIRLVLAPILAKLFHL